MDNLEQKYELLKAQAVIDAARIDELESGIEKYREYLYNENNTAIHSGVGDYSKGCFASSARLINKFEMIFGE